MTSNDRLTRVLKHRLPIVLSIAALAVAVFGSTPLAHAVGSAVVKKAAFAKNAGAVNGIKASRQPRPGRLLPLGQDGKFPASVGAIGPAGPRGPKGDKGDTGPQGPAGSPGVSGWGYYLKDLEIPAGKTYPLAVPCPAGQKVLGGGISSNNYLVTTITESAPSVDPGSGEAGWGAVVYNHGTSPITAYVWAICANVS